MSMFKTRFIKGFLATNVFAIVLLTSSIAQAAHWGDFKDNGCVDLGNGNKARSYSAILWDIPWGESWEYACSNQDAWVHGHYFPHPTACVKTSVAGAIGTIGTVVGAAGLHFPPVGLAGAIISATAVLLDLGGWGALNMWGVFYVQDGSC